MDIQDIKFRQACAAVKLVDGGGLVDLTEDDFLFLTQDKIWVNTDRPRVRRVVESCVYGALDMVGLPRFPAPAEFVAGAIAYFVSPVNIQYACAELAGCEWAENVVNGVEEKVRAPQLFALALQVHAHTNHTIESRFQYVKDNFKAV